MNSISTVILSCFCYHLRYLLLVWLQDILLNFTSIVEWIKDNWYWVLAGFGGLSTSFVQPCTLVYCFLLTTHTQSSSLFFSKWRTDVRSYQQRRQTHRMAMEEEGENGGREERETMRVTVSFNERGLLLKTLILQSLKQAALSDTQELNLIDQCDVYVCVFVYKYHVLIVLFTHLLIDNTS